MEQRNRRNSTNHTIKIGCPLLAVRYPLSAVRFWQGKFPSLEGQGWAFGCWLVIYNLQFIIYNLQFIMETYEIIARLHKGKDINAVIQDLADYKLIIQRKLAVSLNIWLLSCNDDAIIADDVLQAVSQHPDVLMVQRNHTTTPRKTSLLG
jgi:hypothetical protein